MENHAEHKSPIIPKGWGMPLGGEGDGGKSIIIISIIIIIVYAPYRPNCDRRPRLRSTILPVTPPGLNFIYVELRSPILPVTLPGLNLTYLRPAGRH